MHSPISRSQSSNMLSWQSQLVHVVAIANSRPLPWTKGIVSCRSQRQKAALQQQQTKYHELVAENRRLQEQHDAMQKENFEVTEYLRREILAKDEKAAAQEVKIEQVRHRKGGLTQCKRCYTAKLSRCGINPVWLGSRAREHKPCAGVRVLARLQ